MGQLEDMSLFIRVVEAGGISRAADQLGLAKSAVSRRLAELEARLGARLINRTTRTSSLTEVGRTYYERALRVVDDVTELNASITDRGTSLQGVINLAAPLSFGLSHLSPAIDAFLKQHPELTINIDLSDRHVDLVEEGLDLAFRIADLKDSSLIARRICPINLVLCASPDYLRTHGTPATPEDLKTHQLLYYKIAGTNNWKFTEPNGKQHLINFVPRIRANNGEFLRNMAIAGHGIVSSPTFIIWQAIAEGKLVPLLADYCLPQPAAYAVYPQTRYLSQRTRMLIDFLVARFGDNPYWDKELKLSGVIK